VSVDGVGERLCSNAHRTGARDRHRCSCGVPVVDESPRPARHRKTRAARGGRSGGVASDQPRPTMLPRQCNKVRQLRPVSAWMWQVCPTITMYWVGSANTYKDSLLLREAQPRGSYKRGGTRI
jgi:hypothetical protein